MTQATIKQGDVSPIWRIGVPAVDGNGLATGQYVDLSAAGWTCRVKCDTTTPPVDRSVTTLSTDNTRFLVQLTPDETDTLSVEGHKVWIEVANATLSPPFKKETRIDLTVETDNI